MLRGLRPRSHPHALLCRDVLREPLQRRKTRGFADTSTVQTDGHHLRHTRFPFLVEHIKGAPDVVVVHRRAEARRHVKLVVVAVVRVWDHQHPLRVGVVLLRGHVDPVGKVVGVGVGFPKQGKAHLLVHVPYEGARARREPAAVPAPRGFAADVPDGGYGFADVFLLLLGGHVVVVDPTL